MYLLQSSCGVAEKKFRVQKRKPVTGIELANDSRPETLDYAENIHCSRANLSVQELNQFAIGVKLSLVYNLLYSCKIYVLFFMSLADCDSTDSTHAYSFDYDALATSREMLP